MAVPNPIGVWASLIYQTAVALAHTYGFDVPSPIDHWANAAQLAYGAYYAGATIGAFGVSAFVPTEILMPTRQKQRGNPPGISGSEERRWPISYEIGCLNALEIPK